MALALQGLLGQRMNSLGLCQHPSLVLAPVLLVVAVAVRPVGPEKVPKKVVLVAVAAH
jgi:hypothetical protein